MKSDVLGLRVADRRPEGAGAGARLQRHVARQGEQVLIRFMNEGLMMHPWHLHGMPMRVVARDGYPLGSAAFTCDTLGVNPGERWDVMIDCNNRVCGLSTAMS